MIFLNKKGVSPLIATMLLIAFAIALGAVVINLGSPNVHPPDTNSLICDDIILELIGHICYNPDLKQIEVPLDNKADSIKIPKLEIGIQSDNYHPKVYDIPLIVDRKVRITIPYNRLESNAVKEITITPLLDEENLCNKNKIVSVDVIDC